MKKFLLSLLAAVTVSLPAFAVTETLTAASFESPSTYTKKDFTSTTTKVAYHAYFMTQKGVNMQMNNKNSYSIYSSSNPDNKIIKSISVNVSEGSSEIKIECSANPYTVYSHISSGGEDVATFTSNDKVTLDPAKGYKYFHLFSGKGAIYIASIEIEYQDEDESREFVTLSFAEDTYNANLGEDFESPALTCSVEGAREAVEFTSSEESVATVDANGQVTIIGAGATVITASIPEDNESYYGTPASYDLIVKDPNAISSTLNAEFFKVSGTAYTVYTQKDEKTSIEYTVLTSLQNGDMQFNIGSNNGKGSGIVVSATNPNYEIQSVSVTFSDAGAGVNIYKQDTKFAKQDKTVAISTDGATQVAEVVKDSKPVAVNAPAFAIVPASTGVIKVSSVVVTYTKTTADDGSVPFVCDAFSTYMICKDETVEIALPEDAPEVTYTSSDEDVACVEGGEIMALDYGSAEITATWEAVAGKWQAGEATFTVYVKYATLKEVLEDAQANENGGFVQKGKKYIGNFPLVIGADMGRYNYVTDGTAWALFYVDHNHGEGAVIDAGWSGTYTIFDGVPEFTNIEHSDITDHEGEYQSMIKTHNELTIDESMINDVMVLNDVTFAEATKTVGTGNDFTGTFNGQELTFYNQFDIDVVEAGVYNVKCVVNSHSGNLQIFPIEYIAQEATAAPSHTETVLNEGDEVVFEGVEDGAHVYYRHGGQDPDHTNVFTEAAQSVKHRVAPSTEWTYNHTTHPLTFTGDELSVAYMAKKAGKAPSAVQRLAISGNGQTTSIVELTSAKDAGAMYDLQGRKVVAPARGLYIQNGVKRVVR